MLTAMRRHCAIYCALLKVCIFAEYQFEPLLASLDQSSTMPSRSAAITRCLGHWRLMSAGIQHIILIQRSGATEVHRIADCLVSQSMLMPTSNTTGTVEDGWRGHFVQAERCAVYRLQIYHDAATTQQAGSFIELVFKLLFLSALAQVP